MLNMTSNDLVGIIRTQVCEGAIAATLAALSHPPGREPSSRDIELSGWFNALNADAQLALRSVISEAAEQAVFNLLALLDDVCPAQNDDPKGRLELSWVTDGRRSILNEGSAEELHRLFAQPANERPPASTKGLKAYEVGEFSELLSRQSTADLLHLHRVPIKSAAFRMLPNYDPKTATCMALPQEEHRRVESSR
jgi:hypothetical protein